MKKIKRPELKVPDTLVNLYYDLRDRRLLPLVALLLVAIVAAPLLLSEGGGGEADGSPSPVSPAAESASGASVGGSKLTVIKVDPGIRNPRKRLAGRRARDPFTQQYTGTETGDSSAATPSSSSSSPSTTTTTTTTPGMGGESSSSSNPHAAGHRSPPAPSTSTSTETTTEAPEEAGHGSTGSAPAKHHNAPPAKAPFPGAGNGPSHLTLFAFEAEVRITKRVPAANADGQTEGGAGDQEPVVKEKVKPATPLPGPKQPVVTYMGTTDGTTALLMVSNEVSEVSGEGKCLSGVKDCQLIALAPKEPEVLVYGPNRVRYKIEVLQLEPVVTGHT